MRRSAVIATVILGKNIDTPGWIRELKANFHEHIIVIDYDHNGAIEIIDGVIYSSNVHAEELLDKFDSIYFYKSIYIYPGTYKLNFL